MFPDQEIRACAVKAIYWAAPVVDEAQVRASIEVAAHYIKYGEWEKN